MRTEEHGEVRKSEMAVIEENCMYGRWRGLKVNKNENFLGFAFEFCTFSLLVLLKY
jgi:hypothetical protein